MDNRSALIHCALELFAARGYDAVGVQEIVEAAGVTKPTLYHYFGSKQGLLQALLNQYFDPLNAAIAEAARYQGDLTFNLQKVARVFFDFARQNRTCYRLQLALWFAPRQSEAFKTIAAFSEQQYQLIETMFASAERDHGNMIGRHPVYAATFQGMINTYIGLWLNDYGELSEALIYRLIHQFEHGIYS